MRIIPADFDDAQVLALLAEHLDGMRASSPAESVFALDLSGLRAPQVSLFCAWQDATLLAMGALKLLTPSHAEIKSMRTARTQLRKGAATAMLDFLLARARATGCARASLETGSGPQFEPALALYRRRGFVNGTAFGDYAASAFNQFLHLDLH